MRSWRWIWGFIRFLFYLAFLVLLLLGEKSSSPGIRGLLAGFLIADVLTDILFALITLPTLDGREAVETLIKTLVALAVIHYWGFNVPSENDAISAGFLIFLLTAAIKTTGFALRLFAGLFNPDED